MDIKSTTVKKMHNRSYTKVWEEESITNADSIELLESIPKDKLTGKSVVNKQLTKEQVWNIFMDAAKEGKPDDVLYPSEFKNMRKEFKNI